MSSTPPATSFPLGAYLGNPDNSSAANEATFEADYSSFSSLLGAKPQFLVTYTDYNQPISAWINNAGWAASSFAASPDAKTAIPVIGLAFASTASGAGTPDAQFQAFASGQYDSVIQGIVQAWTSRGFKNLVFRPGWEMNLPGPTYAGDSAQSQADWVAAFRHVSTVLHQDAAALGAKAQVVWNPGTTNYSNAEATANLYPGNSYVDAVGADVYGDMYPYSDSSGAPAYHDWDTGGEDTSVAQFIADPVNRTHYWSYPAATKWVLDSSSGHSQSLTSLIQFAAQQGKPFVVPETGAGNSSAGTDVADDAAFPQWLASQLSATATAGEKIGFVNLWDSNGGGNYNFSSAADGKPQEAAAWAKYFGAQPAAASNTLTLDLSGDDWKGDPEFTVAVDGKQLGSAQSVAAVHGSGQSQAFSFPGLGAGSHDVALSFVNDAWGGAGTTGEDRNLYVDAVSYAGANYPADTASLHANGTVHFLVGN